MSKKVIAIDLGSTLSEVAVLEGGQPVVIINEEGSRTTPSVISFKDGERKVGSGAKRQAVVAPKETVTLVKRLMGSTYSEASNDIKHMQYDVVNEGGYPRVKIGETKYSPEELSAMILAKMKQSAESYLGEGVSDAIITVPAYFNDAQRQATKKAGEIAGLNVLRIIAEPTAALLASTIDKKKGGKFMVVDYGGATLDFSVADIADDVVEILASDGDTYCGGSDLDKILSGYIVKTFKDNSGIDVTNDPMAMSRITEAAEKAKVELSSTTTTEINLPYIAMVNGEPKHIIMNLSRATFESLIDTELDKVIRKGKDALLKSGLSATDLSGILLVGGSTRIPKVQQKLTEAFGVELIKNINPDEAVAMGAAIQGGVLSGDVNDIVLLDVTPLTLGIMTMGEVMTPLITANTTIPCTKSEIFSTAVDNQPGVEIVVLQGERPMAKDNKMIGTFNLEVPPAKRGVPQIEVTFDIDANGILSVSAKDKGTGKSQSIKIEAQSGLTDADIERMKKEAEEFKAEDDKKREDIAKRNAAEALYFSVEKVIDSDAVKDKMTEEEKININNKLEALRKAIDSNDAANVESAKKALEDVWTPVVTKMYSSGNGQTAPNESSPFAANPADMFTNNPFGGNGPFTV